MKTLLEQITQRFHKSRNIHEKRKLSPLLQNLREHGYTNSQIFASFGEDAAAIQPNPDSNELILLTTDAILPEFIKVSPRGAGYSAIYVGIDDIIACGGTPLGCSVTLAYQNEQIGNQIFDGIIDATNRFRIPLIRGHTRTDSPTLELTATTVGTTTTDRFLSAAGAQIGDFIAVIWDADGQPVANNKAYWNTITMKTYESFYAKRAFFGPAIDNRLISACKDIANGGILGTVYQMMAFNGKGAEISLDILEQDLKRDAFPYTVEEFLFLFLTSGFLVTGNPQTKPELMGLLEQSKMRFYEIGTVIEPSRITLSHAHATVHLLETIEKY
ncbi:MAG: AIR synthase related protein [Promethearchaeota archaeon]